MALIVEDGTGLTNSNSYALATEADAYFLDRANADWAAATDGEKAAALIKATAYVDAVYCDRFLGTYPLVIDQALRWPKSDAVTPYGLWLSGIPQALKAGVCEAAVLLLSEDLTASLERGGAIASVKVGPIEQTFESGAPSLTRYPAIDNAIKLVLRGGGSQIRVVRG